MLKRISIKNFQSLRKVRLELGRFTAIVGESDVGKSALVRSIKAAINNQAGQGFISYGESECGVELACEDGTLAWVKGDSATYLMRANGSSQTEKFSKLGRLVPSEVEAFLRICDLDIGDESFNPNIHSQFSLPFLIGESGTTRARLLGELSGVNRVYLGIQEARRREQAARRQLTTTHQSLQKCEEEIAALSFLDASKQALDSCRAVLDACIEKEQQRDQINALLLQFDEVNALRIKLDTELSGYDGWDRGLLSALEAQVLRIRATTALLQESERVSKTLRGIESELKTYPVDLPAFVTQIEWLSSRRDRVSELERQVSGLTTVINGLDDQLAAEDRILDDLRGQAVNIDTCPLCGQATGGDIWTHDHVDGAYAYSGH